MATVLLLRHGRTASNANGTLAGRQPVGLDETGERQAREVGARLARLPLAVVVTSPLVRCRQTLELALPAHQPTVDERLTECGYGAWTGRQLKDLAKDPLWSVVQTHPSAVVFPEGEALAAMSARAVAAVRDWDNRVSADHGCDALWLACSHADVIKAVAGDALGMHIDSYQRIVTGPGSLTVIRYTPVRPFVLRMNDTGSDLADLVPAKRRRTTGVKRAGRSPTSDAVLGGGAG